MKREEMALGIGCEADVWRRAHAGRIGWKRAVVAKRLYADFRVYHLDWRFAPATRVVRQRKSWPEKNQRVTKWFNPAVAAELVYEPELSELIKAFAEILSRGR